RLSSRILGIATGHVLAALARQDVAGLTRERPELAEEVLRIFDGRATIGLLEKRPQPGAPRRQARRAAEEAGERAIATRKAERLEQAIVAHVAERPPARRTRRGEERPASLAVQGGWQQRRRPGRSLEHLDRRWDPGPGPTAAIEQVHLALPRRFHVLTGKPHAHTFRQ